MRLKRRLLSARAAPQVCGTAGSRQCLAGGSVHRSAHARRVCARRGQVRAKATQTEEGKPEVTEDAAPKQSRPGVPGAPGVAKMGSAAGAPKLTFGTNANAVRFQLACPARLSAASFAMQSPRLTFAAACSATRRGSCAAAQARGYTAEDSAGQSNIFAVEVRRRGHVPGKNRCPGAAKQLEHGC